MPRLSTKTTEFADLVCCFLHDKLSNMDEVLPANLGNENFEDFCEILRNKGIRAVLLQYYMHVPAQTRVRYRLIRDVFINKRPIATADFHLEKSEPIELTASKRSLLKKVLDMGLAIITGKRRV